MILAKTLDPPVIPRSWNFRSRPRSFTSVSTVRPERIPHPATEQIDLATVMRTVGDPLRLQIVRTLADGRSQICGELAAQLDLPDSTLSYHLKQLREAGVTRTVPQGTLRQVSLRKDDLEARFPGLVAVLTR
jgi:DNA-binding transcriptional ArsR family regulator